LNPCRRWIFLPQQSCQSWRFHQYARWST
jgi:hypothetical protein